MLHHSRILVCVSLLATLAVVGCAEAGAEPEAARNAPAQPRTAGPIEAGSPFPAGEFAALNSTNARVDLATVLGTRPVAIFYWIPGHPRSEAVLGEFEALLGEIGGESLAAYAVAVPRKGLGVDTIKARVAEIGTRLPVLIDEDFSIGRGLRVQSVPNITLIDADGVLRLSNGASLRQELGYKLDVATAVRKLGETGSLMTHGYLDRYFPAKELEGQDCPDFKAPLLTDNVEQRYHSLLDDSKLNVLVFWSVDCPHCRTYLPKIQEWARGQADEVNVVTAANVGNDAVKTKTREFCRANGLSFTTLVDKDARIGTMFRVTSTPTIVLIGPDRKIDTVVTSSTADFEKVIEERKRSLL